MKLVVVLDGERHEVVVDRARSVIQIGRHEWPYHLVTSGEESVTFEMLGERIDVRDAPAEGGTEDRSLAVNGELHTVRVESRVGSGLASPPSHPRSPSPPRPPGTTSPPTEGAGHAIVPPMPGKVLEVRVRDGDRVQAGQVLLVVEAMKMRNEVTSPVAGKVAGVRVAAGTNVAAAEVLLRVVPAGA